jgi:hypothetical protein
MQLVPCGIEVCISMIKLNKIALEIGKENLFRSICYVKLLIFQTLDPIFLYLTKCGERIIKI